MWLIAVQVAVRAAHLKHDVSRAAATFNAGLHVGALLLGATNAVTIEILMWFNEIHKRVDSAMMYGAAVAAA